MSQYQQAINALFARTGTTARLGLERTHVLLEQLGNPHRAFPSFHVAGTNGKGSVVAMLYALLRAKGLSVGRYTSPHLSDFRERIVVDDEQISEEEVLDFLHRWEPEGERLGATFFEITTVMAFEHFARRGVDVAVIETGMGGRLDATNVITPVVAGVTSVSMDHAEFLGDSLAAIAREKAGIFKPEIPAVLGPLPPLAGVAIRQRAAEIGAPLGDAMESYPVRVVRVTAAGTELELGADRVPARLGLVGSVQGANASVALAMLAAAGGAYLASEHDARSVLPGVRVPGRFQRVGRFVLDVAHNVEGIRALCETLRTVDLPRPLIAVVGILGDKEWREMLRELAAAGDRLILTRPESAPEDRVWNLDEAAGAAVGFGAATLSLPLLSDALIAGEAEGGSVLVTGSFYTVGEALRILSG